MKNDARTALGTIFKFSTPATANAFIARAFTTTRTSLMAILGDDGRVWVVSRRDASRLIAQGYELA